MILLFILVITTIAVAIPWQFFQKEKRKCRKYAFYKLRDDIAWRIATSDDVELYRESYEMVNDSIAVLHHFNFRSFLSFMTDHIANSMEEVYQARRSGETVIDREKRKTNEFDERFSLLLGETAKKNSLLLRLSMTPFGHKVMFAPLIAGSAMKFLRKHPELARKVMPKLLALRSYSNLGESLRKSHDKTKWVAH